MAENPPEESTEKPAAASTNNASEQLPPEADITTPSTTQSTEIMEVHHHAHHAHGKKNWKSYFWEFFMLFLAVFCGFLAEIQVEHYVEHQREKTYIKSLVEDLAADTVKLENVIRNFEKFIPVTDSFVSLIDKGNLEKEETVALNYVFKTVYWYEAFKKNDRTIIQLYNAGNFRLIKSQKISNAILEYDNFCKSVLNGTQEGMTNVLNNMQRNYALIFDMTFTREAFTQVLKTGKMTSISVSKSYIINKDQQKLFQLKNSVYDVWAYSQGYLLFLKQTKDKASALILLIKNQYKI